MVYIALFFRLNNMFVSVVNMLSMAADKFIIYLAYLGQTLNVNFVFVVCLIFIEFLAPTLKALKIIVY